MTNEILHGAALRHAGACACIALLSAAYGANGWVYDTSQRIAETRCDREVALSSPFIAFQHARLASSPGDVDSCFRREESSAARALDTRTPRRFAIILR